MIKYWVLSRIKKKLSHEKEMITRLMIEKERYAPLTDSLSKNFTKLYEENDKKIAAVELLISL